MEWLMEMPIEDIVTIVIAAIGLLIPIVGIPNAYLEYKRRQSEGRFKNKFAEIESAREKDLKEISEREGMMKVVSQMAEGLVRMNEGQQETSNAIRGLATTNKDLITEMKTLNSSNRESSQAITSSIEVQTMSVKKLGETVNELKTEIVTVSEKLNELLNISRDTQKDIKPVMAEAVQTIASAVGLIEKAMAHIEKLTAQADNDKQRIEEEKDDELN